MIQHSPRSYVPHRFAGILSANPAHRSVPHPICDTILLETDDCVVTPTLGSILPLWLLVIPRAPMLNFASMERRRGHGSTVKVINQILSHYSVSPKRAIWFEHGASREGCSVGCGVDYAHLHLLIDPPFSVDALASAGSAPSNLAWKLAASDEAFSAIGSGGSYLIVGSDDSVYVTRDVDQLGSQFLRRQVASLAGIPEAWNYRTHPHIDNVRRTIAAFAPLRT